jgi:hypothetical protein
MSIKVFFFVLAAAHILRAGVGTNGFDFFKN